MLSVQQHNEFVKKACLIENKRIQVRLSDMRENKKIRGIMAVIIALVILAISWGVAGAMRILTAYIIAGVASGLDILFMLQFIPPCVRYVKKDDGYVAYMCIQFLRKCDYIPDTYKGKPVIGLSEGVFKGVKKMYYISLPASLRYIGKECFKDCHNLKGVLFRGDSELATISDKAFSGCNSLYTFYAGENIRNIGVCAFENCSSLRTAYLGNNVENIGEYAFCSCGNLAQTGLSDCISVLKKAVFSGCFSLQSMPLPLALTKIEDECFGYCTSLQEAVIPDKVDYIGQSAFSDCSALQSVVIKSRPSTIGNGAFRNCKNLTVTFTALKKPVKSWNGQCFDSRVQVRYGG